MIAGVQTAVATVEDTILAKLEWAKLGGSARQRRDVVAMLAVQRDRIDTDYLHHWAAILEVAEDLQTAIEAAESET